MSETGTPVRDDEAVFDPREALDRIGGDESLLRDMIGIFGSVLNDDLEQLEKSVRARDREMVRRNAHRIKGSIGNFGINKAYKAALALEQGSTLPDAEMDALHATLKREIYELNRALMRYVL